MADADALRRILSRIDGRGYKAYRDIRGEYELGDAWLCVDRVQADPFATPSRVRVRMPAARAALPSELREGRTRRMALADYLARCARREIEQLAVPRRGSGARGLLRVDAGAQEVLERTAVVVADEWIELRLEIGLPAAGRRVLGAEAEALLCDRVPRIAERALCAEHLPGDAVREFVTCVENQEHLRAQLEPQGLVAFVADGAVLPRESGASDRPLAGEAAIPFCAPETLRRELELLHPRRELGGDGRRLAGLGIPAGVTLIAGGGYHGKSTLLRALERGVYPHVPGDGREWVVSDPRLVKIRAEDGRRVEAVDISGFISQLPGGRRTDSFRSEDASGSTSQAAAILEALEAGARGLLLDEDTCATNFMLRDARMQALVDKRHEPITPFLDRVRELHRAHGVSSVLVMGGCGDYFDVADAVILMRDYRPLDATREARAIAARGGSGRRSDALAPLRRPAPRCPVPGSLDASRGPRRARVAARALDAIEFGRERIDLRQLDQLVDAGQTRAIGCALRLAAERYVDGARSLGELLDALDALLDEAGLDALAHPHGAVPHPGDLARPRRFEIAAALNRLRSLRMRPRGSREARADAAPWAAPHRLRRSDAPPSG